MKFKGLAMTLSCVLLTLVVMEAVVVRVKDGDTLVISEKQGGSNVVCRLYAIDAPERKQPFGRESAETLRRLTEGGVVTVKLTGERTYGREVCIVEAWGRNVNILMVRLGMAWVAHPYLRPGDRAVYIGHEQYARSRGRGLWRQSEPVAPWNYRKRLGR